MSRVKYNLGWTDEDDAEIERYMISQGGEWTHQGTVYGKGLFYHFKQMETLVWPEDDHHRWSDTILKEYLSNRITVVMGSRDSTKTRSISKAVMIDYYCFEHDTLILMTSTNIRGLELRVWGDIKSLHDRAKDRYEWLPGNVADSKHGIFTDSISDGDEVRDMRKGIICFPDGTMVDTPRGPRPIETIRPGDVVVNAIGSGVVKRTMSSIAERLVRVVLSDGRTIDCTPEHPFFTQKGWQKALALDTSDRVFSAHETMSLLQQATRSGLSQQEILLQALPGAGDAEEMQAMRKRFSTVEGSVRSVLQHGLRGQMGSITSSPATKTSGEVSALWKGFRRSLQPAILFSDMSEAARTEALRRMWANVSIYSALPNTTTKAVLQCILQMEVEQSDDRKTEQDANPTGIAVKALISRSNPASQNHNWETICEECSSLLRTGLGVSKDSAGGGDRWGDSQSWNQEGQGQISDGRTQQTWVDRVEILEPCGDDRFDERKVGYSVRNLEVGGHPSYSVNGVIAHNCVPCIGSQGEFMGQSLRDFCGIKQNRRRLIGDELQFIPREYLKVLDSLDKGDFKAAFLGNPIAENGKALDAVSEPIGGWDSLGEVTKTTIWKNKYNGVTINLVGIDSPNFDPETKNRFPYMVDQGDVDRVSSRPGGKDSIEWWSQIMGVRKVGAVSNRVLTVPEIEGYDGFKEVIWSGGAPLVRVYAIDAGFGGDDCVRTYADFGEAVDGTKVIQFGDQKVIPILVSSADSPEKQIAKYARGDCATLGIPASNVFFDAGMYATLAVELAREMSPEVNAVNFGGTATERPVDNNTFVFDERIQAKRLKTWYEHVSKFVTELWFVVRLAAQCRQVRKFPRAAAEEFGRRQWKYVYNDRYELETKEDYKLRNGGESPNHADSLVIAVEGARRLGFTIENIPDANSPSKKDDDYLEKEMRRYRSEQKKRTLHYS